jgi:multiple sugar transport system substrate-binding protein
MRASRPSRQRTFAQHHGQPARRDIWDDDEINERFGGCYRDTMTTMDGCWVRPRYRGYLGFQQKGGELIEAHLRGDLAEDALLTELQRLHAGG